MRRIVTALLAAFLIALPTVGSSQPSGDRNEIPVAEFVRAIHADEIPFAAASRYSIDDSEVLLPMLRNGDDALYWPNITMVLGIVGDGSTARELIEFLRGRDSSVEWSPLVFRGRASALGGLGYLAHENRNNSVALDIALGYLIEAVHPTAWMSEVSWLDGREDAERRRLQLSASAILGLALSGHDAAADALKKLVDAKDTHPRLRQVAESAIPELEEIQKFGLAKYYEASDGGEGAVASR